MTTLTVTTTDDSGAGSLRATIAAAATGDTIVFAANLAQQTITLTSGQLDINKSLSIDSSATAGLTLSGNNASRILNVQGAVTVDLKNLTFANGKLTGTDEATGAGAAIRGGDSGILSVENCQFKNNVAGFGGAIYTGFKSTNTVIGSTFDSNEGFSANSERGAGAIATKSAGSLTVKDSTFTNNKGINGGAINSLLGNLTVENSTFSNNDTTAGSSGANTSGYGGAIYTDGANASGANSLPGPVGGTIAIRNSVFDGNKGVGQGGGLFLFAYAPDKIVLDGDKILNNQVIKSVNGDAIGGGLRLGNSEFSIKNTLFSNNLSLTQGGGLWVGEKSPGTIVNSTFVGNKAEDASSKSGLGGAITVVTTEAISIVNSTITKNSAGFQGGAFWGGGSLVTLQNTIVANNTADNGGNNWAIKQNAGSSQFSDGGGNFQWPAKNPNDSSDFNVTDKVTIADPTLDVLQTVNGVSVVPLLVGSPAIDAAVSGAPVSDAHGQVRVDGDNNGSVVADSGAYEFATGTAALPQLAITATDADKAESAASFTFTVNRTGNLSSPSSADWMVSGDSATADDFAPTILSIQSVSFAANETSKLITIMIADDKLVEADETFKVVLSNPNGATLSVASATGTIRNDDIASSTGTSGNDVLTGTTGNDTFNGGAGNDTCNGDLGVDSALYAGVRANFTVQRATTGFTFTVTDKTSAEGTDTLTGIEKIKFSDSTEIRLDISGVSGQAYRVYRAAFDRAPDAGGLGFWIDAMDKGASLQAVANGFVNSTEFLMQYGLNPTPETFVTKLYNNVLHRAYDQSGFDFWIGTLKSGANTQAAVLAQFSESIENQDATIGLLVNGVEYTPYFAL